MILDGEGVELIQVEPGGSIPRIARPENLADLYNSQGMTRDGRLQCQWKSRREAPAQDLQATGGLDARTSRTGISPGGIPGKHRGMASGREAARPTASSSASHKHPAPTQAPHGEAGFHSNPPARHSPQSPPALISLAWHLIFLRVRLRHHLSQPRRQRQAAPRPGADSDLAMFQAELTGRNTHEQWRTLQRAAVGRQRALIL